MPIEGITPNSPNGHVLERAQTSEKKREHPINAYNIATEVVIGLVGPLGVDMGKVRTQLTSRFGAYKYDAKTISVSKIITELSNETIPESPKFERYKARIDKGNWIRTRSENNAALAFAAVAKIRDLRGEAVPGRTAYIISSLKHPKEVEELRRIYGDGFFLIAVHAEKDRRLKNLEEEGEGMTAEQARALAERDEHEASASGQHMRDTFHLADFFVADENNEEKLKYSIWRCVDLIFGDPLLTPTFNEFAMFMAFASSLRSGDLSRQVGAVIAKNREILSTGANDCPSPGGGLYWPVFKNGRVCDVRRGRDSVRGFDSNSIEKRKIIDTIVSKFEGETAVRVRDALEHSSISDLTEYGRVVHAEMEALMSCARRTVSCSEGTLFCTTFPCHNCAKHIIASGIKEVVYVEPYPKSKALQFHDEATVTKKPSGSKVRFKPFVGVGPRKFFDLFAMSLGSGRPIKRKKDDGNVIKMTRSTALPRVPMMALSYLDFEAGAGEYLDVIKKNLNGA